MFEDCLDHHGLRARCCGFRMGPPFGGDPGLVAEERRELLVGLCRQAVEEDGAEVVILAGGPLAGLAPVLQPQVAVPLVDGTQAAVRLAVALAGLAPLGVQRRSRPLAGYDPALTRLYAGGA
jgi:Asp/Glu/hydantoin racemase